MKKKIQSTQWLDFLTYILIPLVFIFGIYDIIQALPTMIWSPFNIVVFIAEIIFFIFLGYTFYKTHTRSKESPKLLRILVWITAISTSLDFANTECINNGYNFFVMFAIYFALCYILWIRTNEIYLEKRKDLFGKLDALKNTYRCKQCKRLVPNGMECPYCKKEEAKETDKDSSLEVVETDSSEEEKVDSDLTD